MMTLLWTIGFALFCFLIVLPLWFYLHSKWKRIMDAPIRYLDYWWDKFHPEDRVDDIRYE